MRDDCTMKRKKNLEWVEKALEELPRAEERTPEYNERLRDIAKVIKKNLTAYDVAKLFKNEEYEGGFQSIGTLVDFNKKAGAFAIKGKRPSRKKARLASVLLKKHSEQERNKLTALWKMGELGIRDEIMDKFREDLSREARRDISTGEMERSLGLIAESRRR